MRVAPEPSLVDAAPDGTGSGGWWPGTLGAAASRQSAAASRLGVAASRLGVAASRLGVAASRLGAAASRLGAAVVARAGTIAAPLTVGVMTAGWAAAFAALAVERHLAGGSHAEDLGFTDQILSNFLRGQWFRMSIYQGASWNTELDISRIPRPDSLFAFHDEPMLLLLAPIYALVGGISALLVLQAAALAAGAIPAYHLAACLSRSRLAGVSVAAAYLLSPLGQWAVLADFHTSALAAPLLLLAVERLVVGRSSKQALAAAVLALSAREDVGPAVTALGVSLMLLSRPSFRPPWPSRKRHASVIQASHRPAAAAAAAEASRGPAAAEASRDRHASVMQASRGPAAAAAEASRGPAAAEASRERHASVMRGSRGTAAAAEASRERHASVTPGSRGTAAAAEASRERHASATAGVALVVMGVVWTIACLALIRLYSAGVSPFEVRYGPTVLAGWQAVVAALQRESVLDYGRTLALSGVWLGFLSPLALVPALPSLALNALSTSPWMASGKAHYSGLVLPFIVFGAAAGLGRLRNHAAAVRLASLALIGTSTIGYRADGAGPGGGNYSPATVDAHAQRAAALAASLPSEATVSASSALVPRVSRRPGVYVFPTRLDADSVFLDVRSSPAPTSAGDVYLRVQALLASGAWQVDAAEDGLLVLRRAEDAAPVDVRDLFSASRGGPASDAHGAPASDAHGAPASDAHGAPASDAHGPPASDAHGPPASDARAQSGQGTQISQNGNAAADVTLLDAELVPSSYGAIDVDGPRSILRTTWRAERPIRAGTRLEFEIQMANGRQLHVWDIADLWWTPPERWVPGQPVQVDVPDIAARQFRSWQATWSAPP